MTAAVIPATVVQNAFQKGRATPRGRGVVYSLNRKRLSAAAVDTDFTVRIATPLELWAVADVHAAAFYPDSPAYFTSFVRLDRVLAMLDGQEHDALKTGTRYVYLVARRPVEKLPPKNGLVNTLWRCVLPSEVRPQLLGSSATDVRFVMDLAEHMRRWESTAASVWTPRAATCPRRRSRRTAEGDGVANLVSALWKLSRSVDGGCCAYLSNLAVSPQARNRRVGSTLVAAAEHLAAKWGCWCVALHCDAENTAAINLYSKLGYVFPETTTGDFRGLSKGHMRFKGCRLMVKLLT